jgi:hypothetical protein
MELSNLERNVMEMLLSGDDPTLRILADQFRVAKVTNRELTGVGFYTTFSIPPQAPRLEGGKSLRLGDVTAEIQGLQHGAGFILFVNGGVIDFLEGYSFDEPWPDNTENVRLSYMGKRTRDLAQLQKELR